MVIVKVNVNGRAETVEEIVARRKMVALDVLHTLHRLTCEEIENSAQTDRFKKRVAADTYWNKSEYSDKLIASIKEEAAMRVRVYEEKAPVYFTVNANLGKAISDALALPLLARGKLDLWLQDVSINLLQVGRVDVPNYLNFAKAAGRATARRQQLLLQAERDGDKDAVKTLALEECIQRRLITSEGDLETPDEVLRPQPPSPGELSHFVSLVSLLCPSCKTRLEGVQSCSPDGVVLLRISHLDPLLWHEQLSQDTPLLGQITMGETEATKLLCQAGANLEFRREDNGTVGCYFSLALTERNGQTHLVRMEFLRAPV